MAAFSALLHPDRKRNRWFFSLRKGNERKKIYIYIYLYFSLSLICVCVCVCFSLSIYIHTYMYIYDEAVMIVWGCKTQGIVWGKRRGSGYRRVDPDEPLEKDDSVPFHAAAGGSHGSDGVLSLSFSLAVSEKRRIWAFHSLSLWWCLETVGSRGSGCLAGRNGLLCQKNDASVFLPCDRRSVTAIGSRSKVPN